MVRTSKLCFAFAPLFLLAACGDDDGSGRIDASIPPVFDAAVDPDDDADPGPSPDAAVADAGADPDATPEADAAPEPDAMPEPDAAPEPDGGAMGGGLLITEIVDGDLTGGQPKFVELTNTSSVAIDLTQYSVGIYANANTDLVAPAAVLTGTLPSGASHVLHYDSAPESFTDVYGFAPDQSVAVGGPNGDDTIALFLGAATGDGSDATLVDLYGLVGTDGTGTDWEYADGYATRLPSSIEPSPTLVPADWTVANGGLNDLDAAAHAAATSPGAHTFDAP